MSLLCKLLYFLRKWSISGIISFSIILILCCNTGLAIVGFFQGGGRDATQLAKNLAGSVCYSMGLYVFIFIFRNAQKLIDLFHKWREVDAMQNHASDASLHLSINTIAGTILISAIAENAVSHLLLFPLHERVPQPLQYYYENSHKQWSLMIPYHATAAIGVFLCNKWAVYAWNFGDIFIAVISRGLYGKFKRFVESVEEKLLKSPSPAGKLDWLHAIEHHDRLSKLTEEFADLLSPLVFTSFAVNIYFICIQLHLFLAPSKKLDFVSALYVGWSFLHLVARTYVCALSAAKINDYAHNFVKILYNCPRSLYTVDVERAERKLASTSVGLHGLGAFHIGRPFILSVISVIFTFEIVLLQTSQMMPATIES
ncbi:gustatory receptor for sugar taste 64f [Folsomia candida]|uniref:gustatory receptor for sugar taste 64f n=1 Tax=Folsomia candida TaxID=158441 RepID=UPI001604C2D5|nr:gustatory receptor for sugar taste 64f [Folsomia candida]